MKKQINIYAKKIKPYIIYAPEIMQKKFFNYHHEGFEGVFYSIYEDFIFNGLLFRNNKVFAINISIHDKQNNYEPRYLEITDVFNDLMKYFNIYHTALLLSKILKKKYYRESTLAENIINFIKNDNEKHKPKFRYRISKHRSRERKFIEDYKSANNAQWYKILFSAVLKSYYCRSLKEQRTERFDSLYFIHTI